MDGHKIEFLKMVRDLLDEMQGERRIHHIRNIIRQMLEVVE